MSSLPGKRRPRDRANCLILAFQPYAAMPDSPADPSERPPLLRHWWQWYAAVGLQLLLMIAGCYAFTHFYAG